MVDSSEVAGTAKLKYFKGLIDDEGSERTTSIMPIMTAQKLIFREADVGNDRPACLQNLNNLATLAYSGL